MANWQKVVMEVGRILKPGGIYALDDFTKSGLERFYHKLFNGPVSSHFTTDELSVCLEKAGLKVGNPLGLLTYGSKVTGLGYRRVRNLLCLKRFDSAKRE